MPSAFQAGALARIDGDRVAQAGERRVDLAEIALELAEPLADGGVLRAEAAARPRTPLSASCRRAAAADRDRRRGWRASRSCRIVRCGRRARSASARRRSAGRQARVGPSGPRVLEPRRPPRRLLEMRRRPIGTLAAQPTIARDTGAASKLSMPLIDQDPRTPATRRRSRAGSARGCRRASLRWRGGTRRSCPSDRRRPMRPPVVVAAAHVAERAEPFELIEMPGGQRLRRRPPSRRGVPDRAASPACREARRHAPACSAARLCCSCGSDARSKSSRLRCQRRISTIRAAALADRSTRNAAAAPTIRASAGSRSSVGAASQRARRGLLPEG